MRFQKGRAIKAGYVYPASFDRLPEVAGKVVVQDSNLRGDPFGTHYPPMQQWQAWMEL